MSEIVAFTSPRVKVWENYMSNERRKNGTPTSNIEDRKDEKYLGSEHMQIDESSLQHNNLALTNFPISFIDFLCHLPIKPSLINAKLLHICKLSSPPSLPMMLTHVPDKAINLVSQYVVSFDGQLTPNDYNDKWVPWAIKTPILAHLALYSAACYQAEFFQIPVRQYMPAIKLKVESIELLNELLLEGDQCTSDEAIAGVVHLTISEWFWGKMETVQAHMKGLQEMIGIRGGLNKLNSSCILLKSVVL